MLMMAPKFKRKIHDFSGVAHTSSAIFTFKDGSLLLFEIALNPNIQATGDKETDANKFAASVESFLPIDGGFEFVFMDGSKLSYNLSDASTYRPGHPKS